MRGPAALRRRCNQLPEWPVQDARAPYLGSRRGRSAVATKGGDSVLERRPAWRVTWCTSTRTEFAGVRTKSGSVRAVRTVETRSTGIRPDVRLTTSIAETGPTLTVPPVAPSVQRDCRER